MIVRLRVAGLTLRAHAPQALPGLRLPERLRVFSARQGSDIDLEVREEAPPRPAPGARLFDSGGLWSVHRHGPARRLYLFKEPVAHKAPWKALVIDEGLRRGTLYVPRARQSGKAGYALGFPLDEILFQHRLTREGGLFVHACAVRFPGGAAVFCGVSGAGKTTLARLFHRAGHTVLSDDRIALVPQGRRTLVFGTPWHGSGRFGSPRSAPLRALFFIEQAEASEALRLPAPGSRLFSLTFPPLWDGPLVSRALEACGAVASRVPAYRLRFRKDASALRVVRAALQDGAGPRRGPARPRAR